MLTLTSEERASLAERAKAAGLPLARFCREAALGRPLAGRVDRQALAEAITALAAVAGELGKIGSNVNQLAHWANSQRHLSSGAALSQTLSELDAAVRAVATASRRLVETSRAS
jgi:ABC-type transporter Mla subunit MlaD